MPDKKKELKFVSEQHDILEKLLDILEIKKSNTFLLYDLDNDTEKQTKILSLSDDIKKYYPSCLCTGVNGKKCLRPFLSIIRYIIKYHKMKLFSMNYTFSIKDKCIRTKKYTIILNI